MLTKEEIADWFRGLQSRICVALEELDGEAKFESDIWSREGGGGGHKGGKKRGKKRVGAKNVHDASGTGLYTPVIIRRVQQGSPTDIVYLQR